MELLSNYGRGKVAGGKFQAKAQAIITRAESGPCYSQETGAALPPPVEVPLFMLPIMLTETLPDNQKRARICLYAKALSILVRNPGVADETFTLRGTSIKIKDMLQDTVLNWTRVCCLFCLEGCQPLPPQVRNRMNGEVVMAANDEGLGCVFVLRVGLEADRRQMGGRAVIISYLQLYFSAVACSLHLCFTPCYH
jgi:hypothetical protein